MSLQLTADISSDGVLLWCTGRIVVGKGTVSLSDHVKELLNHKQQLVIDLSQVDNVDAGGLGTLVRLQVWARNSGRNISFRNPSAHVMSIIELVGLQSVLQVCHTRTDSAGSPSFYDRACGCA